MASARTAAQATGTLDRMADDTERWISEVRVGDGHGLVSIAEADARAPVVCRCGWSTRPTTRERGIAAHLRHRQRVAIETIAGLGADCGPR